MVRLEVAQVRQEAEICWQGGPGSAQEFTHEGGSFQTFGPKDVAMQARDLS